MLNKRKSNRYKAWKITYIIPLVALFLWSFNTNEITVLQSSHTIDSSSLTSNPEHIQSTIQFIVNKDSSDEEIKKIMNILRNEYELGAKFKNIKRNSRNQIIGISLQISSKKGAVDYQISDNEAIESFIIVYDIQKDKVQIGQLDQNKKIIISTSEGNQQKRRTEIIEIHPDQDENHEFIFIGKNDEDKEIIIKKNNDENEESTSEKRFLFITDDEGKEPLIFIDGKKVTRKEMKELKSDKIVTINVIKGGKAIEKYGNEAKNGVIDIKTKNKS